MRTGTLRRNLATHRHYSALKGIEEVWSVAIRREDDVLGREGGILCEDIPRKITSICTVLGFTNITHEVLDFYGEVGRCSLGLAR